jgi:hypothetical protein
VISLDLMVIHGDVLGFSVWFNGIFHDFNGSLIGFSGDFSWVIDLMEFI